MDRPVYDYNFKTKLILSCLCYTFHLLFKMTRCPYLELLIDGTKMIVDL